MNITWSVARSRTGVDTTAVKIAASVPRHARLASSRLQTKRHAHSSGGLPRASVGATSLTNLTCFAVQPCKLDTPAGSKIRRERWQAAEGPIPEGSRLPNSRKMYILGDEPVSIVENGFATSSGEVRPATLPVNALPAELALAERIAA